MRYPDRAGRTLPLVNPALLAMIIVILTLATPAAITWVVLRRLQRSNRVSPQIPTYAPLLWLWVPHRPARLHRRLRRVTAVARAAGGGNLPSMPELAGELERRACATDSKLVLAAKVGGPARWGMLNEVEREVRDLELLATRMLTMTTTWSSTAVGTEAIAERLDALEAAMREVDEIASAHSPRPVPRHSPDHASRHAAGQAPAIAPQPMDRPTPRPSKPLRRLG